MVQTMMIYRYGIIDGLRSLANEIHSVKSELQHDFDKSKMLLEKLNVALIDAHHKDYAEHIDAKIQMGKSNLNEFIHLLEECSLLIHKQVELMLEIDNVAAEKAKKMLI
jgi:hypothetical protein